MPPVPLRRTVLVLTYHDSLGGRFHEIKNHKAQGWMRQAQEELDVLVDNLSTEETSLKVKCLLKVRLWWESLWSMPILDYDAASYMSSTSTSAD